LESNHSPSQTAEDDGSISPDMAQMMNSCLISDESISILRQLLGISIHTLFAPHLDAAGAHLASPSLAMLLEKNRYLNFTCERFETPHYLNDSWQIRIAQSSNPLDIPQNSSGALIAPCTINMYGTHSITKIAIYEYLRMEEEVEESVQYDQSILFECSDGHSFCIACMLNGPGIATYLHFSEDKKVIQEMTGESHVRLILE
jgi:hypothetical protein